MRLDSEKSPSSDLPDNLPDDVVASLKARYGHGPVASPATNQAVLADAARHLKAACRPRRTRSWQWVRAGLPLATAAGFLLLLIRSTNDPPQPEVAETVFLGNSPELTRSLSRGGPVSSSGDRSRDIDRDGQINILDAFLLARLVVAGDADPGSGDLNQDGTVDQQDIDLVAADAVLLTMN